MRRVLGMVSSYGNAWFAVDTDYRVGAVGPHISSLSVALLGYFLTYEGGHDGQFPLRPPLL